MPTATRSRRRKPTPASIAAAKNRRAELFDKLDAWEEDASPEEVAAAVAMFAAIDDGYSERNAMMIAMQDPEATQVAGYRQWQDAGRQVTAYPEGQGGITIVRYAGKSAARAGAPAADAPPAEAGAEGEAKKERNHFALTTVHDIRFTVPLFCGACGEPMHRTGWDKASQRHTWTHTGSQPGHPAELPRRDAAEEAS